MDISDIKKMISSYFKEPQFKEWQPSQWLMDSEYNTLRKLKKLERDKIKEDAKLKAIYDKNHDIWNHVFNTVDEVNIWPSLLKNLFFNTIKWTIEDVNNRHNKVVKAEKTFKSNYGEYAFNQISALHSITPSINKTVSQFNEDDWKSFAKRYSNYNFNSKSFEYPLLKVKDWKQCVKDADVVFKLRKNDDVTAYGFDAYKNAIIHITSILDKICIEVKHYFLGNIPTDCETAPHWGEDGKFNGILTDGKTRVSFKSFAAGGYNIQKFHYRFKVSELKK